MPRDKDGRTPKQARFAAEYMIDSNASKAALRAGYSPKTAFRAGQICMQKSAVRSAIAKRQERLAITASVTAEQVVAGLLAETQQTGERGQSGSRVAAWAHLAKHLGMMTERVEHVGEPVQVVVLRRQKAETPE